MMTPDEAQRYIEIGLQIVGAAAAISAVTPNPTDNVIVAVIKVILNTLGANWGAARNEVKAEEVIRQKLKK